MSTACPLSFSKYPYAPPGECLAKTEVVKAWGSLTTKRCCLNALDTFSQALALHALDNEAESIFVGYDQWQNCAFPVASNDSISKSFCGFENLYEGSTQCSGLSLSAFQSGAHRIQYSEVINDCTQIGPHNFNDTCSNCAKAIKDTVRYLMGHLQLKNNGSEREICSIAVVTAVAANKIREDSTWVRNYYRCLPALYKDGNVYHFLFFNKMLAKKKQKKKRAKSLEGKVVSTWSGLYRFSKAEIENAINFGTRKVCLGTGTAGRVFKGVLPSGQMVAIKHIYKSSNTPDCFTREVDGLSRIRHPNLVCLMGCCEEGGDQYLVYEYCSHGNLAQQLKRTESVLSWEQRVKILRDSALALRSRLEQARPRLTNILLTANLEPKLSDLGLAKMSGMEETRVFTDGKGNICYMDPEYMTDGKLTSASDIYGFGIVILQILSGKQSLNLDIDARDNLTKKAKDVIMHKRPLSDFKDPRMGNNYNPADFESILYVAVLCVAKSSKGRPTINIVFEELENTERDNTSSALPYVSPEVIAV
ncbi:hypothetical protein ACLOJK_022606 [Asimina triloba]